MSFDLKSMFKQCIQEVDDFAKDHSDETFYAFAIDADMFCLNSEEGLSKTLQEYRDRLQGDTKLYESFDAMTDQDWLDVKPSIDIAVNILNMDPNDKRAHF